MERHYAQPIVISLAVKIKYVNSQVNFLGLSIPNWLSVMQFFNAIKVKLSKATGILDDFHTHLEIHLLDKSDYISIRSILCASWWLQLFPLQGTILNMISKRKYPYPNDKLNVVVFHHSFLRCPLINSKP